MSGTHFYLTLPSNASLNEFPNNKTTSYRVKLQQSIDLEGVWEVGLYSISYPNTWYTLQNGVDTVVLDRRYGDGSDVTTLMTQPEVTSYHTFAVGLRRFSLTAQDVTSLYRRKS